MSFTVKQLISRFRLDMDDLNPTYLWSEDEIKDYLDQAQIEFTDEVDVLYGTEEWSYDANEPFVAQPGHVTRLRGAYIEGQSPDLELENYERWKAAHHNSWRVDTDVAPKVLITDVEAGKVRLYPIPTSSGTMMVDVYRNPLKRVSDGAELEVTDKQQQLAILLMTRALAYLKQDSEAYDPGESQRLEDKFYAMVDEFKQRVARKRRRNIAITYGGI